MTTTSDVLVGGEWRPSHGSRHFTTRDPATGAALGSYPVSPWSEISEALDHGADLFDSGLCRPDRGVRFLRRYADRLEQAGEELVASAHEETGLAPYPRLGDVELPRTTGQLRQAADAADSRSWVMPTISTDAGISSYLGPLPGVVVVFGPNNFPFAFNAVAGGDFAAAIATGHPVLAKAHPGHPRTSAILAREAHAAIVEIGSPPGIVQMVYHTESVNGLRVVADPRTAATAFTGSQTAGLALKRAADEAGKPIYLEMSGTNPVVLLPGALEERGDTIASEMARSLLSEAGQYCTGAGVVFVPATASGDHFVSTLSTLVTDDTPGPLLDERVAADLEAIKDRWADAGAQIVAQSPPPQATCGFPSTLMEVPADEALGEDGLLGGAFGNLVLIVRYRDVGQLVELIKHIDGSLAGSVYSHHDGRDDDAYQSVVVRLRYKVGRLIDDKPPTGVGVVPAMNHGGPFPATGHPLFTSVGVPASLRRFGMLQCFDNVRHHRLPPELHPDNPLGLTRFVDGVWTSAGH